MVTSANRDSAWQRASYLELQASRDPQSIGALLPHVLARYGFPVPSAPQHSQVSLERHPESEDRHYDDAEDMHTLAASAAR